MYLLMLLLHFKISDVIFFSLSKSLATFPLAEEISAGVGVRCIEQALALEGEEAPSRGQEGLLEEVVVKHGLC